MLSDHQDLLKSSKRLFHVSEEPGIKLFNPRPSPSAFAGVNDDVVFAVEDRLLHNYLLPRDCPRVTYYATAETIAADKEKFKGYTSATYVIIVESGWYRRIRETILYCYEFPADNFAVVDACAGYYVSYQPVVPLTITPVNDVIGELLKRDVELRFTPSLVQYADAVSRSTLNFSLIRMRNVKG